MTTDKRDAAADLSVCDAATPGEWRWDINLKSRQMSLKSTNGGGWTVLDFVRWGMSGAKARFLDIKRCLMVDADKHAAIIPGREHHALWCQSIDHPDARFIAMARTALPHWIARTTAAEQRVAKLTAELQRHRREELKAALARASDDYCCSSWSPSTIDAIRRAIEGETVEDWPADGADVTAIRRLRELAGGWFDDNGQFVADAATPLEGER